MIMMGVTSTEPGDAGPPNAAVTIRSIKNDIAKTTETVEVQTLGRGEPYEQCHGF
jgi:hypothetical protein